MRMKSPKRWRRLGSLLLLVGTACTPAEQTRAKLTIDLQPTLALKESGDSVTFGDDVGVIAAPRGEYVVLRAKGRGALAFYDSAGRLQRVAGTKGRGPGEFTDISGAAVGPGDSLFLGDRQNGRVSILDSDHRFVRSWPADPGEATFTGTPHGRLMLPGVTWNRERVQTRHMLRLAPWNGSKAIPIASSLPMDYISASAADRQGRFWIADRRMYTIRLFDGDRLVRTIQRQPDWFPADTSPITQPAWIGKGRPFITALCVGEDGVLWVLIKRKNPRYGDTTAPKTKYISPMGLPPLAEIFEGVLEALDPGTGALLDSRVVPGDMIRFIAPGRLYQKTDADSSGALMLQIWEARLKPPNS